MLLISYIFCTTLLMQNTNPAKTRISVAKFSVLFRPLLEGCWMPSDLHVGDMHGFIVLIDYCAQDIYTH